MFAEEEVVRSHKTRADILFTLITLAFAIILIRLWYLQIYQGDLLYQYSIQNRLRKETVKAPRGMIFSRNNQLLVDNVPRFDLVIIPQYLTNKKDTIKKLSKILEMDEKDIYKTLKKYRGQARYRPVRIKKNISNKEVAIVETENEKLPGVQVETFISREYRDKEVGSHLLGYIGEISQNQLPRYRKRDNIDYKLGDFIGQAGIEERFDRYLRGEDGYQIMEVDARGRMRRSIGTSNLLAGIQNKKARPGNNLRLTIDRDMQITAYKALEEKVGGVVAVDVRNGEVLTMVSRPSFDPGQFSKGLTSEYWNSLINNPDRPLRDRTIQDHYAPGSTFKTFTGIAALEEGIIKAKDEIMCGPRFRLGRRTYNDWKRSGHGITNLYKSLRRSVDVYYYKIAVELDIDILAKYARMFGLGEKTGIALPRETTGLIPTREWKEKRFGEKWQDGETVSCVIGQSYVLATPLQLAVSYAAIANGGKVFKPQIVREVFNNKGDIIKSYKEELIQTADISEQTLVDIRQGLYEVANHPKGTGWWVRGTGIKMAGKSGTSQVISMTTSELFSKCSEKPYNQRHHGLFVAFAPYENPRVAVAAVVEHGCSGSGAAGPIVRDVLTTYMKKYMPDLHQIYAKEDRAIMKKYFAERRRKREEAQRLKEEKEKKEEQASESEENGREED